MSQLLLKELQKTSKRMDNIEEALSKMAKGPATPSVDTNMLAEFSPKRKGQQEWPVEYLQKMADRLNKAYNHGGATSMLMNRSRKGLARASGIGPHLADMARVEMKSGNSGACLERLGKEGFTTMEQAENVGVKRLDGKVIKTALAEGSGLTGGYIIPPQWMNTLMSLAAEDAFIEPRCTVMPMTSRTLTLPMLDITTVQSSGVSPYFGGIIGYWQPEAASINESEPQFKSSDWTAWDLVMYTVSSNQLLQDNGIGLDALLTQLFSAAIPWYKEYAFLRGVGAGSLMPMGIINAPASYVQARTTGNSFVMADVAAMMSRLLVRSWDDACWIMHPSVLPKLIQMFAATGAGDQRLVWLTPYGDGKEGPMAMKMPRAFFNGLPLYFTEKLPQLGTKGDVCLVDWSSYVIGNRLDLQIAVSGEFLFRTNQLAWRVVCRCDGKPWLNSTISDSSGWVSSPYVILS